MAPKFEWRGAPEPTNPTGVAVYTAGNMHLEVKQNSFEVAFQIFHLIQDAYNEGHRDGAERIGRAVQRALEEV